MTVTLYTDTDDATLIEEWIAGQQIVLDNIPMRIEGGVGYQLTNVYGRPERQGEPGPADHPYNATYTQRTWVGGQLVHDLQETADIGKYWRGSVWSQTRNALGAGLKVVKVAIPLGTPQGACTPLGRMNRRVYFAAGDFNGHILEVVEADHSARNPGGREDPIAFRGSVTNVGVVFRRPGEEPGEVATALYIPTSEGYTRLWSDYTTEHAPDPYRTPTVGLVVHEDRVWRLTTAGQVWSLLYHDDIWELIATIPDGSEPRNIYRDYDDDNNRVVAVTTSSGLWLLDPDNGLLWETDLTYPEHVYQGYGACNWRADAYISVGIGIHRKASGLITAVGLDKDDGLPSPFAGGFIVDLEPSYNMLVAAVAGELKDASGIPPITAPAYGLSQGIPYPLTGKGDAGTLLGTNRMGAIYLWNGLGWSELYSWNAPPTRVMVSQIRGNAEEEYQHGFFGDVAGGFYTVHLPSTYYNPIESPNLPIARTAEIEGSRIDWNTPDTPKVAKQLNIKPDHLWHQPGGLGAPTYHNQLELICHWIDLEGVEHRSDDGSINGPGPYPFVQNGIPVETLALPPADAPWDSRVNTRYAASIGWERYRGTGRLLATGLPHEAIWLSFRWRNDGYDRVPQLDAHDPIWLSGAVVQWYTLIARKWMRPTRVFTFRIDAATAIKGLSEQRVLDILDGICLKKAGVPLVTGDRFFIVDVTRLDGSDEAGLAPPGWRTVTCLEFTDFTYETIV